MTNRSNTTRSTRPKTRPTRRLSPCYRHPNEPITGICPSCLRERLSGLDPTTLTSDSPELRRSKSVVSVTKCDEASSSNTITDPRRKSCDVVSGRNSLSNLFDVDDVVGPGSDHPDLIKVETKNLGLSRVTYTVVESECLNEKIDVLGKDSDEEVEKGEFRTMKEYIELECQIKGKKTKDFKDIAGSLASVFSKKLRKWKVKSDGSKQKKVDEKSVVGEGNDYDVVRRRRSCDIEPRFSVDGGRISFEEPRASWDGYMIARTIPRLAPMFSVVENGILNSNGNRFENHRLSVDGPMHAIMEDDSSSGGSGNFHSDSSSSLRGSSFDQSSSVKSSVKSSGKKAVSSEDRGLSPANVKLVITEKELKDWRLNSGKGDSVEKFGSVSKNEAGVDAGNLNVLTKKSAKWRKVCNVLGFKLKNSENKAEAFKGNVIDPLIDDISEKQGKEPGLDLKDLNGWKLTRSSSVVGSRNVCDVAGSSYRRRSVDNAGAWAFKKEVLKHANSSSMEFEDGLTPFYMTPLRSLRRSKSGKFKLQSTHSITGNVLQLN